MFKIFHLDDCPTVPMERDRGEQVPLINTKLGTGKLDLHLNRLRPGEPGGSYHSHSNSDNAYIVRRGKGRLVVEGEIHMLHTDDVVYIPAGMKHSLTNAGDEPFEIFEIYAPAGEAFDFKLEE